ncbi:MAG: CHRD domain-containing protein [Planctomycetota bacterium]
MPATLCGCGGGGGGGPPPAPTLLATHQAQLQGSNESTVIDPDARATAVVQLRSDGEVFFSVTGEAAWTSDVTGLHIHRGAAGVDGPIVVDLLSGGATFSPASFTASGSVTTTAALAAEIAADPAEFYVNVHTGAASGGLARAQLGAFAALEWHAVLNGSEEDPVVDAGARGAVTLAVAAPDRIDYVLAMRSPAITDVTDAHVHAGAAGVNGGILVDFNVTAGIVDAANGTISGSVTIPLTSLSRIAAGLAGFYFNAHTAAAPNGVARGQLADGDVETWAQLSGAEEVQVVDPAARGGATLAFTSFTAGRAIFAVPPTQGINGVTGAHVHVGHAGVIGAILIDLMAGADFTRNPASESAEGAIAFSQALLTRMMSDPAGFYVNVHTLAAPDGLARGQLTQDSVTFEAALDGDEETAVVDPNAAGTLSVVMRGAGACSFVLIMASPPAADVTAARVVDGGFGVDGTQLIDLMGGGTFTLNGDTISGDALFTGRTFARLLSHAELFHGNVFTAAAPGGIARGQLALLGQDVPPGSLSYTSPVTYVTGTAITPNVPTSTGGAITSYSVSPALPPGITLDTVTGIISGTPTQARAAADYTVTASNAAGSTTATVNITVNVAPPAGLSYTSPVTYVTGTAITPNLPTSTGGPISGYSVNPTLPAGLGLSASTGVISGTPTAVTAAANYVVTGVNASGSTQATVNITVASSVSAPSNLSYTTPVTYKTGHQITANSPTVTGTVSSYSVSPALPGGLSLHMTTGVISGTPTAVTAAANYVVTASNSAGSTTATVNITVNLGEPTNLSYSNTPLIAYVNTQIPSMDPTVGGGAVSSYSISPALPAGLSISSTTGSITGTPTTSNAPGGYTGTVTASNSAGSTTATVQITIY